MRLRGLVMKIDTEYFTKERMEQHKKNEKRLLGWMALRFYFLTTLGAFFVAIE